MSQNAKKNKKIVVIDVSPASAVVGTHWRATVGTFALRKIGFSGRRRENCSMFLFFMPAGRRRKIIFQKFIFNFFKNKLMIVVLSQGAESKKTQFFETT